MTLRDDGTIDEFWDKANARVLELYETGKYGPESDEPDAWDVARYEVLHQLQDRLEDPRVIEAVRTGDKQKLATMAETGEITPELARRGVEFVVFEDMAGDRSKSAWRADRAVCVRRGTGALAAGRAPGAGAEALTYQWIRDGDPWLARATAELSLMVYPDTCSRHARWVWEIVDAETHDGHPEYGAGETTTDAAAKAAAQAAFEAGPKPQGF